MFMWFSQMIFGRTLHQPELKRSLHVSEAQQLQFNQLTVVYIVSTAFLVVRTWVRNKKLVKSIKRKHITVIIIIKVGYWGYVWNQLRWLWKQLRRWRASRALWVSWKIRMTRRKPRPAARTVRSRADTSQYVWGFECRASCDEKELFVKLLFIGRWHSMTWLLLVHPCHIPMHSIKRSWEVVLSFWCPMMTLHHCDARRARRMRTRNQKKEKKRKNSAKIFVFWELLWVPWAA